MWNKIKSYLAQTPDEFITNLSIPFWKNNGDTIKRIGIVAFLTCLFNYFYFIVNGYGGPDAVCEGVWYYIGENTAVKSARWCIPYINSFFGKNVVIPLVIILAYVFFVSIAAFVIFKLLHIESPGFQVLSVATMVCFPIVTRQFAYLYTALAYAISFLMVVFAAWLIRKRKIISFLGATFCLLIMFGSYQAYIGAAAAIAVICFIYDMTQKRSVVESLKDLGMYVMSGVIAGGLDLIIWQIAMERRNLVAYERAASLSLSDIIQNLGFTIKAAYTWFFMYFKTNVLFRDELYLVLFTVLLVLVVVNVAMLLGQKKIAQGIVLVIAVVILPVAMNACAIIFPSNGIYDVMRYHYVLILPLVFALLGTLPKKIWGNILQWSTYASVFLLIVGFTISSNASAICYKLAYESTHDKAVSMLSRVYELEGYDEASTPIVFGGQPINYQDVYEAFPELFRYAIMESGPVFWGGENGLLNGRYFYLINYLGVNPQWLSIEQYRYVTEMEAYAKMPCWPAEGSVQMIDGYAVVKISE